MDALWRVVGQAASDAAAGLGGMQQVISGEKVDDLYFIQKVKLGQGAFGTVWRAVNRETQVPAAMKQLDKRTMPSRNVRKEDIEREVRMMKACNHVNITQCFHFFEDARYLYLALEYCDGGDFGDKVKERGMNLKEQEAAEWIAQICESIAHLHCHKICHRDIKPDNFMVAGDVLKLSDFGLALVLKGGRMLTEKCGTPAFMAPEQHKLPRQSKGYSFPVDMWAAGVSMYMLMFGGKHPFVSDSGNLDEKTMLKGTLDFRVKTGFFGFGNGAPRFSEEARALCQAMVQADPASRLTAADALNDPWIRSAYQKRGSTTEAVSIGTMDVRAMRVPNSEVRLIKEENEVLRQQLDAKERQLTKEKQANLLQQHNRGDSQLKKGWTTPMEKAAGSASGILPIGARCRYQSDKHGWVPGIVETFNEDGTYDLDVRRHAQPDKISPPENVDSWEAWPRDSCVSYESSSMSSWIPGVIDGRRPFNDEDNTYNLDVREHAHRDRIRARVPRQALEAFEASTCAESEPRSRKSTPTQSAESDKMEELPKSTHQTVEVGSACLLVDQEGDGYIPAIIESLHPEDGVGCLRVTTLPPARQRTHYIELSKVRAPRDSSQAWLPGTLVSYQKISTSQSVSAVVCSFNSQEQTYNLDVKQQALPDRIMPRFTRW